MKRNNIYYARLAVYTWGFASPVNTTNRTLWIILGDTL